jgi:hypothetical protein
MFLTMCSFSLKSVLRLCATGPLIDASGHNVELVRLMHICHRVPRNEDANPMTKTPPTPYLGGQQQ